MNSTKLCRFRQDDSFAGELKTPSWTSRARVLLRVWAAAAIALSATLTGAAPAPFGYWNFDNAANREQLVYGSGTLTKNGTGSATTGPNGATDGAVQMSGGGGWYTVTHNMPDNGGGSYVNKYTLMYDVKYPSSGTYKCLLQTNQGNGNDGDFFINTSGKVGNTTQMGGYGGSTAANTWYRIVLVVDSTSGFGNYDVRAYINGSRVLTKSDIAVDSTLTLDPTFLVSQDDGTEDDTMVLSAFATWNSALSDTDVAGLGGVTSVLYKNSQTVTFGTLSTRTYGDAPFSVSATASSGLGVSYSVVSGPATVVGSTVTITGAGAVTIRASQGGDANYNAAANVDQSFTVNPKGLTITGVTASGKVYDRTTTASLNGGSVSGVLGGDTVTINAGSGAFASANVGTHTVSASGYSLGGAQASKYTLTAQPSVANASITAKGVTISGVSASSKVYDRTATASLSGGAVSGAIGGDTVTVNAGSGAFASANVGTWGVTASGYSLGGAQAGNYSLSAQPTVANASITAKGVTITGVSASNKVYDRTATASLSGGAVSGVIGGDTVTVNAGAGTFASANVGTWGVTASGYSLGGAQAANYSLSAQPTVANASITAATLTLADAAVTAKTYDGTTAATITGTLSGIVVGDEVMLTGTGTFDTKHAGTDKAVTSTATLGGLQAGNYTLTQPTGLTGSIEALALTVTASTETKAYDGTTASSSTPTLTSGAIQTGDAAPTWTQTFDSKDVCAPDGRTLTPTGVVDDGNGGGNYSYTYAPAQGTIEAKPLTVTADAKSKTYGDADPALTCASDGLVAGDALTGAPARAPGENAGTYAIGQGTLDAGANYALAFTGAELTIEKATLTCRPADAMRRFGAANPAFSIAYTGFVTGENAAALDTPPTATCAATPASVPGTYPISLGGGTDNNYGFVYETGVLTVQPPLTGTMIRMF